jgi:hypothetical protein
MNGMMKVGDLVRLKGCFQNGHGRWRRSMPLTGLVVWTHPNCLYLRLHNMQVEILNKYYEVLSASR